MDKSQEILVRPKANIKSRQWWQNKVKKFFKLLNKKKKNKKIYQARNSSLTLLITNNKEIQDLNKTFRKINKPTDVLSFQMSKTVKSKTNYLGDIVISIQAAIRQATKQKQSPEKELILLFIHGFLHLLGYDHNSPQKKKIMFSLQNKLLKEMIDIS